MDLTSIPLEATTQGTAPDSVPCPLSNFSPEAHQYIHSLEQRIAKMEMEAQQTRERMEESRQRMLAFGKFMFANPMSKMFLSAMPKDMQNRLKEMFDGN